MASKKPQQTLADYVTIALSPLLIMALVGSLVFFLLEILYAGEYEARLRWTLFFFVFAMVLVARISIELGSERAGLYGLIMIGVSFLALQSFVEYPPGSPLAVFGWAINLGLMGLIWWSAHRLTWDCTYIDDDIDASGAGVLEAAGLDSTAPSAPAGPTNPAGPEEAELKPPKGQPALLAWWDRYRRYREEQRKKPHTPGVWVVYFSLAALPLFGLGQSLIPPEEPDRRRYAFWLMVCYVASGLGLLLTTSFLGLRRYLRQRKLKMPVAMTGIWLALGGSIVVGLMLVGALLPRPYSEYPLIEFTPIGSNDRSASRYAVNRDSAGKGDGQASSDPARDDQKAQDGAGTKSDKRSQSKTTSQSSSGKSGQGKSSSGGKQGNQSGGKNGNKSGDQNSSKGESRSDNRQDQQAEKRDEDQSRDQDKADEEKRQNEQKKEQTGNQSSGQASSAKRSERSSSRSTSRGSATNPISSALSKLGWLATALKWIVFGVLALGVLFFILTRGLQFLANFTTWARRLLDALRAWWAGLFGRGKETSQADAVMEERERGKRPRPFASFGNPFTDGRAEQLSPDELARYSFEAIESWAWERGLGRKADETPLEFAGRLGPEVPALEAEARGLAALYARSAYARGRLPASSLAVLQKFWQRLEAVDKRPLSA
jgi:hypothetical protein